MMLLSRFAALRCAVIVAWLCVFVGIAHAQNRLFAPENLSNRRLGFLTDASAVGWNPALLGMRNGSELLVAAPIGQDFSLQRQYGFFAKLAPLAVGYTLNADSSLATGELYAGLGFNVLDDILWLGGSARVVNPGNVQQISFETLRWNGSLIAKPFNGLFIGLSATTMGAETFRTERVGSEFRHVRTAPNTLFWTASASYSPVEFLTVNVNYTTAPNNGVLGLPVTIAPEALGLDIGASAQVSILGNPFIVSGNYNLAASAFRLGVEVNVGAIGIGLLRTMPASGDAGLTALVRLSSDPVRNTGQLVGYRADDDGCRTPVDSLLAKPSIMASFLRNSNPDFAKELEKFSPQTQELYNAIQERYYKPKTPVKSITGDAVEVSSRAGYALQVLNVDNSRFPQTTVIVRAVDAEGRSIRGLGEGDFVLKDKQASIVSVKPADSAASTPVDVVLIIDCSGSMANKIRETRENARRFAEEMRKRGADYRIGGILYGLVTVDVLQPTDNFERFEAFIAKAGANQPDEYLPNALEELAQMKFRPNAERIGIVVTDEVSYTARRNEVEPQIIEKLWNNRIKLNKIVKPCDNNGSATAYLTLGREYNIKDRFERILDDIGREITTTYSITYRRAEPKVTVVKGTVQNEAGTPLAAEITLTDQSGNSIGPVETEPVAGLFVTPVVEGKRYAVRIEPADTVNYMTETKTLDATTAQKGDTITMPTVKLRRIARPIILTGKVADALGNAVQADISLTENIDENTQGLPDIVPTSGANARYQRRYGYGKSLSVYIDPALQDDFIPLATELDIRSARQGDTVVRDFVLNRMPKEITVFGKVTTTQPEAKPLENALVTASDVATNTKIAETRTDREGAYNLTIPKGRSVGISVQASEYYADTTYLQLPKRDTTTRREVNVPLIWKNVILTGSVEAEKSGLPVPSALVVTQKDNTDSTIVQATTEPNGTYRMIVPKDVLLRLTAQSGEYFFTSQSAIYRKTDTLALVRNFRLPEALTLRINFPSNEYANPSPFVLDSNGLPSAVRWQDELDRVAANLLLFKNFLGILTITGHTDDVSSDEYNQQLGQRRAEFVVGELVKRGIPAERLQASSQGEKQVLPRRTGENTDIYRARCRRVELVKVKK
ncbi:MAG: OmpA family protein [Candidatus Kapabacteria bacterium]|jgi:DNA invertase Pin-like site-specific DNA recombinase|nr:OmpA family protein [Candidatus Kapabacteria bacterium]